MSTFFDLDLTDVVQIIFWIIVGTLSILTFIQARKTLFQPIKTEVFKLQLAALTRLSEQLYGQGEWELLHQFDLMDQLRGNAWDRIDVYAERVLSAVNPTLQGWVNETAGRGGYSAPPPWRPATPDERKSNPWLGSASPADFDGTGLFWLSEKYMGAVRALETSAADPSIPTEVQTAVRAFLAKVEEASSLIGVVLDERGAALPKRYPGLNALQRADVNDEHQAWNDRRPQLEPAAQKVIDTIRAYYRSDRAGFTA